VSDREVFHFLAYRWDITKAQQIAAGLPVRRLSIEPWWLGLIRVDEDHLSNADLGQAPPRGKKSRTRRRPDHRRLCTTGHCPLNVWCPSFAMNTERRSTCGADRRRRGVLDRGAVTGPSRS
jgi:hypothetical protein